MKGSSRRAIVALHAIGAALLAVSRVATQPFRVIGQKLRKATQPDVYDNSATGSRNGRGRRSKYKPSAQGNQGRRRSTHKRGHGRATPLQRELTNAKLREYHKAKARGKVA